MKLSNRWKKMSELYSRFSLIKRVPDAPVELITIWDRYDADRDLSEDAMLEAYERESTGKKHSIRRSKGKINGYIEGKQWMDLTLAEYWLPDLEERKTLFASDLYQDFPPWFLSKVLPERYQNYDNSK